MLTPLPRIGQIRLELRRVYSLINLFVMARLNPSVTNGQQFCIYIIYRRQGWSWTAFAELLQTIQVHISCLLKKLHTTQQVPA